MLRTNTLELKPTKQQQRILREMLVRSSDIWNVGNYKKRQAMFSNDKNIPSYAILCKDLKSHEHYISLGRPILNKCSKS